MSSRSHVRPLRWAPVLLAIATSAASQTTISPGPESVAVSIYRAPDRDPAETPNLDALRGYALITESRRIMVSAGEGTIRFEGVAGGILPESAIVTGLPDGVVEKNQDANLLGPASLLGAAIGRRVTLRRTATATGQVREQSAIIRSGPQGQVVLQTEAGFEALRCSGIPETIVYDTLPPELSAKPVLSVSTRSPRAATATVTLSYLADAFDWQANYVATLNAEGRSVALFGWVTLASADATSFPDAQAMVIAGRINRTSDATSLARQDLSIALTCWPSGTTSDVAAPSGPPPPMVAMAAPMMLDRARAEEIVVTGARRKFATQEDLGDLKLYRLPERVTIAARAQKQVAFLERPNVPVQIVYRADIGVDDNDNDDSDVAVRLTLRARNRTADGLGLPLPAGKLALYQRGAGRNLLVGEGSVGDKAVGEQVEIDIATATGITARRTPGLLTVTNANATPIMFEARLGDEAPVAPSARLVRRDGQWLWVTTIAANGSTMLRYATRR